ncbi:hypothetical protein [Microbacterium sp. SS28]|uniref:hypothetical protein n=1 Tax=Microbacterium sp. SS28 TaxID=2919948 RepID=UPI001FAB2A90|nr:hypothetical protein [Microbacterium sp. SS28]
MSDDDRLEYAGRIHEARALLRRERRARRGRFWNHVSEALLSIPAGIAVRLGG